MSPLIAIGPDDNLQRVLDTAPAGEEIHLAQGDYRLKVLVTTPGLTIRGAGQDRTRILWDDYALRKDPAGVELNTFRTWTMAICADGVALRDLSVVNDALHPERKGQEVALTVYGDGFSMENCRLTSTQDTLFLGPLPRDLIRRYDGFLPPLLRTDCPCTQTFRHCLIEGTVDFIFGCGRALFEDCEIRSLRDERDIGYVAAPAHALEQSEGFSFLRCRFTCEEGVTPGSIYLARPWRDHGLCVFRNSTLGPHISPLGFDPWNDSGRDKTARFYEDPPVPGRVPWVRTLSDSR